MAKTAEEHNRMRGQALALLAMDHIRERAAVGEEVTLWSLNRDICERYRIKGQARLIQYERFRRTVHNLAAAGVLSLDRQFDHRKNHHKLVITACSAT